MDVLRRLNDSMGYVEAHLCDEIDMSELSRIACWTPEGFNRFFSFMTQMTMNEYIRCRRLTLAAYELRRSEVRVIDVALKYGYSSADAFTKAFRKQHGITPVEARSPNSSLRVYPPASFHIMIKSVAREASVANTSELEMIMIPRGKYAVFTSDSGGFAGDVLPRLRDQIFNAWLADSGYIQTNDYEVEVYHLFPKSERNRRYYEIWIPVTAGSPEMR